MTVQFYREIKNPSLMCLKSIDNLYWNHLRNITSLNYSHQKIQNTKYIFEQL